MQCARSQNGRINWYVDKGALCERGANGTVNLHAVDTLTLLRLLQECEEEIIAAAEKEQETMKRRGEVKLVMDVWPK